MSTWEPLEDRVIVAPDAEAAMSAGGLHIPEAAKEKPTQGTVVAVGDGKQNDAHEYIHPGLFVGDVVLYGKYAGVPYEDGGKAYIMLKASDIMARRRT